MSEQIFKVVKEYIASQNTKWKFVLGNKSYTKDELLKKMEEDEEFRQFIIDEIIKTAVDLFIRH